MLYNGRTLKKKKTFKYSDVRPVDVSKRLFGFNSCRKDNVRNVCFCFILMLQNILYAFSIVTEHFHFFSSCQNWSYLYDGRRTVNFGER